MQAYIKRDPPGYLVRSLILFGLAEFLAAWFIFQKFWLYPSIGLMLFANLLAVLPGLIQVILALVLLKKQRMLFIYRLSVAGFSGALALQSYYLFRPMPLSGWQQLNLSVAFALITSAFFYYRAVRFCRPPYGWPLTWLISLIASVCIQYTLINTPI